MSAETFHNGRITLHGGDCLDVLATLPESSVDSVVTDPPYHFASIVKRFGKEGSAPARSNGATGIYQRASRGFMGKEWDGGGIAHDPATWAAVLRVLKPGGHLVAFHAPKNWHRQATAIEDAGFEIRDNILWLFGSGFPKSHNLKGEWEGFGTSLKPAYEPIVLARKPFGGTIAECVQENGTGALNIDGCRVGKTGARNNGRSVDGDIYGKLGPHDRVDYGKGRWPANVTHDGSAEVLAGFPETSSGSIQPHHRRTTTKSKNTFGERAAPPEQSFGDSGSASRFFYSAKADSDDRLGSKHPTVKPIDLMRWLVRMITPPGGVVLDPFAGTGTTAQAAYAEGCSAILIEREEEYRDDIRRRMDLMLAGPVTKTAALNDAPPDFGPLFNGGAA